MPPTPTTMRVLVELGAAAIVLNIAQFVWKGTAKSLKRRSDKHIIDYQSSSDMKNDLLYQVRGEIQRLQEEGDSGRAVNPDCLEFWESFF